MSSNKSSFQLPPEETNERVSLKIGDLPGYTGWARPAWTTAHWYQVVYPTTETTNNNEDITDAASAAAFVGIPFKLHIVCRRLECQDLNAIFYVRAYGPTILTGTVQRRSRHDDQQQAYDKSTAGHIVFYEVNLMFLEPGDYVLEVVLTFSNVPPIETFPIVGPTEPAYEGHLLAQMPAFLTVRPPPPDDNHSIPNQFLTRWPKEQHRKCRVNDVYETSLTSALARETWKLHSKVSNDSAILNWSAHHDSPASLLTGYQAGYNSIGFRMEYKSSNCHLPSLDVLVSALSALSLKQDIHLVFIGDSNMDNQIVLLRSFLKTQDNPHRIKNTILRTNHGLYLRNEEIRQGLVQLEKTATNRTKFFVLFNAGLHDVDKLCARNYAKVRQDTNLTNRASSNDGGETQYQQLPQQPFSCSDRYRHDFEELVRTVQAFPFALRVFQTTSAGWLKWGVYGVAWPHTTFQVYPRDSHACAQVNKIAWQVLQEKQQQEEQQQQADGNNNTGNNNNRIAVMDAYWLSLSRPDHREIKSNNQPTIVGSKIESATTGVNKLVHLGVELYDVLLRKWLTSILFAAI